MAHIQEGPYGEEIVKHCVLQFLQNWAMSRSSSKYPWPFTKTPLYWLTLSDILCPCTLLIYVCNICSKFENQLFFVFFLLTNYIWHWTLCLLCPAADIVREGNGDIRDPDSLFLCIELCPRGWTANDQIGWIMTITVLKHMWNMWDRIHLQFEHLPQTHFIWCSLSVVEKYHGHHAAV